MQLFWWKSKSNVYFGGFFNKEKDGNTLEATLRQPKVLIMNTMMEILAPIEDFEIASNTCFTFC